MKYILLTIIVAAAYIWLDLAILNYKFVLSIILGDFPLVPGLTALFSVWQSLFTALSTTDTVLLIITAVLLGINVSLLAFMAQKLQGKRLKFMIGGTGLLGIASTGCAVCGFSILSFLGLGAGLSALPFGSNLFYLVSITILSISILYSWRRVSGAKTCEV